MDNKDLHIAFMLDEFFKSNPKAFPNVECIYPQHRDDDIVLTYETKGKLLGSPTVTNSVPGEVL